MSEYIPSAEILNLTCPYTGPIGEVLLQLPDYRCSEFEVSFYTGEIVEGTFYVEYNMYVGEVLDEIVLQCSANFYIDYYCGQETSIDLSTNIGLIGEIITSQNIEISLSVHHGYELQQNNYVGEKLTPTLYVGDRLELATSYYTGETLSLFTLTEDNPSFRIIIEFGQSVVISTIILDIISISFNCYVGEEISCVLNLLFDSIKGWGFIGEISEVTQITLPAYPLLSAEGYIGEYGELEKLVDDVLKLNIEVGEMLFCSVFIDMLYLDKLYSGEILHVVLTETPYPTLSTEYVTGNICLIENIAYTKALDCSIYTGEYCDIDIYIDHYNPELEIENYSDIYMECALFIPVRSELQANIYVDEESDADLHGGFKQLSVFYYTGERVIATILDKDRSISIDTIDIGQYIIPNLSANHRLYSNNFVGEMINLAFPIKRWYHGSIRYRKLYKGEYVYHENRIYYVNTNGQVCNDYPVHINGTETICNMRLTFVGYIDENKTYDEQNLETFKHEIELNTINVDCYIQAFKYRYVRENLGLNLYIGESSICTITTDYTIDEPPIVLENQYRYYYPNDRKLKKYFHITSGNEIIELYDSKCIEAYYFYYKIQTNKINAIFTHKDGIMPPGLTLNNGGEIFGFLPRLKTLSFISKLGHPGTEIIDGNIISVPVRFPIKVRLTSQGEVIDTWYAIDIYENWGYYD